jgi:RNA-directed DNA polymerase
MGLAMNDLKTVTWRRSRYEEQLDEGDRLRVEIAEEAELDLTEFAEDTYNDTVVVVEEPDEEDVDFLTSVRVLERWERVAGRGTVSTRRIAEHRAILDILPLALATLANSPNTTPDILSLCTKLLRYERGMTPAVGRYLITCNDDDAFLAAFDTLLRGKWYLNSWQTWWLQQPIARIPGFVSGPRAAKRIEWARQALKSAEHTPILHAHAALTLARLQQVSAEEILRMYDRSSNVVRPVLVAAIGLLRPSNSIRRSVVDESQLHKWVYDWAAQNA